MYCFGISNNSPDSVLSFLKKRKTISDPSEVAILPSGIVLKENKKPVRDILFVLNITDFTRNLDVLNSAKYGKTCVFLFASPLRVNELRNCVSLDTEQNQASAGIASSIP